MKIHRRCKCGCGGITNYGKKYIWGHNWRNKKHSKEHRKKLSLSRMGLSKEPRKIRRRCECGCGNITNYGKKYINGHSMFGKKHSEETKLNLSLSKIKYDPNYPYCEIWKDRKYKKDIRKDYCENIDCRSDYERLDNHHIDLNKKHCSPENIMTLCRNCHLILHHKLRAKRYTTNPKHFIIINRPDHVSYVHKLIHKIIRINKRPL